MDNNAFKDLVRSKVKSTKQIAREAVEEAFAHKKKKRKRHGGRSGGDQDDLDSSDSEAEGFGNKKKNKKHDDVDEEDDLLMQPSSVRSKDGQKTKKESYRDRAKERREGKSDYEDSQKLLEAVKTKNDEGEESALDATELSQYLGGDEAHTHLVKGLDVALYRREKEPKKKKADDDSEEEDDEEPALDERLQPIDTKEEALAYVQQQHQSPTTNTAIHSALGRSMLQYHHRQIQSLADLKNTTVKVSGAGAAVQRTQLVFAIDWNPQNLARSWEVPSEQSNAATMVTQQHSGLPKASPLSRDLIQQIISKQQQQHTAKLKSVAPTAEATKAAATKESTTMDDDSDDDIFPDAGD